MCNIDIEVWILIERCKREYIFVPYMRYVKTPIFKSNLVTKCINIGPLTMILALLENWGRQHSNGTKLVKIRFVAMF